MRQRRELYLVYCAAVLIEEKDIHYFSWVANGLCLYFGEDQAWLTGARREGLVGLPTLVVSSSI